MAARVHRESWRDLARARSERSPDTFSQKYQHNGRQERVYMEKVTIEQHSFVGIVWFGAWLFTIGFLQLTFWRGVFAILLWPYYLGVTLSSVLR
jgi:hypothetical protein